MLKNELKILAISGSLRPQSSAQALLNVIKNMMPSHLRLVQYDGLASMPHFDDIQYEHAEVKRFKEQLRDSDAVLICTPEYAFGVPGSLKNALDWTVATSEFDGKPVALVTASSVGDKGHASLLQTLTAISTKMNADTQLLIPFIRTKINDNGELKDMAVKEQIQRLIEALVEISNRSE